jgi:hypothetical protein
LYGAAVAADEDAMGVHQRHQNPRGPVQSWPWPTGNIADKKVADAAIIASAQAVEHYEMTRYGALIAWARELGRNDFADILTANLQEEMAADAKLSAIAEAALARCRRDANLRGGRRPHDGSNRVERLPSPSAGV